MAEETLEKMRKAVNRYRKSTGRSVKMLSLIAGVNTPQQLSNILSESSKDNGIKAREYLSNIIDFYDIEVN